MAYYFVLFMTHPFPGCYRHDFRVLVTQNPLLSVHLHNQKQAGRDTEDAAPYWQPRAVAGPFKLMETAALCSVDLIHGTRGTPSKIHRLRDLAKEYSVLFYSDTEQPKEGYASFLSHVNAPEEYRIAVEMMDKAVSVFAEHVAMEDGIMNLV
jgi:hypothetical protein